MGGCEGNCEGEPDCEGEGGGVGDCKGDCEAVWRTSVDPQSRQSLRVSESAFALWGSED